MIDLHTHTTASDGRCTPEELVSRAASAGVTVLSVTDHDTVAAAARVTAACTSAGIEFIPGIEVTAIVDGADVHILGYFIDTASPSLAGFLTEQRRQRVERVRQIIARLAELGVELDADAVLAPSAGDSAKAAGRPWIARALVKAGVVANTREAFDRFLKRGQPAFVPRRGPMPADVFSQIHAAGGLASIAHPGLLGRDDLIPPFVAAGLDAIEAHHSKHSDADTARYLAMAAQHEVAVSGGSDYHGDPSHDVVGIGGVSLPPERFQALRDRCATRRATASSTSTSS
ncbi:MAG TPA: PHP domain-containing protein [Vicinamibacterales bacterium]|nr:PHP domain-containing protein [Vicinamibacterales bacterium]